MNVNVYNTTDYENIANWTLGESKPNSNPIKACPERIEFTLSVIEGNGPISSKAKMNLKLLAGKSGHTRKNLELGLSLIFLTMTLECLATKTKISN